MKFHGKTAIVTGGSSGIGAAIARSLEVEGAIVEIIDVNRPEPTEKYEYAQVNLSDFEEINEYCAAACKRYRKIDFLVNCAAAFYRGSVQETNSSDFDRLYSVNLRAPFLLVRGLFKPLAAETGASVVNVSSTAAVRNIEFNIVYDCLKAALNHMTRGLAGELAPSGIRVNAIMPGGTATPGLASALELKYSMESEEALGRLATLSKSKRVADPEAISDTIRFLLSDDSRWVSGSVIAVDNAQHVL